MIISTLCSKDQIKVASIILNIDPEVASPNDTTATSNQLKDRRPKESTATKKNIWILLSLLSAMKLQLVI